MSRVLVIGDLHCPGMRPEYLDFLLEIQDAWSTNTTVLIGDIVDWAAISFHEKNPSQSSAAEEFQKAFDQVQEVYSHFPKAIWLIGNHDALTERQAGQAGLPPVVLKEYSQLWETPGWQVIPRMGVWEHEGVKYCHGEVGKGGMYAASKNARENFCSWVQGHCHSEAGVWYTTNETTTVFGMNVGCGIDRDLMAFNYGKKFNKKPVMGCGVVLDGKRAYFESMQP